MSETVAAPPDRRHRQLAAGATYLIPAIVGNVIPLITLPIVTRVLTPVDYGLWALALGFGTFLTGLANCGLTLAYDRSFFEYRDSHGAARLLYSLLAFVAVAYGCCLAATWAWQEPIARWLTGSPGAGALVFWAVAATGMSSLKSYYLAYLRNHGDAKAYVWFTMDETLLTTFFSVPLVAYFRVGVIGLAWGQVVSATLVFVFISHRFVRTLRPRFSRAILVESLRLGYPLTPRIFLGALSNNFDKYLLGLLASVGSTGVFAIGQRVSYLVFVYMNAMENVFGPEVYRRMFDDGEAGRAAIGRYLTPFVYLSFAVALLVSLFSEEVLTLLTPGEYHGAIPVVNLLTLYYAVMFFGKQPQLVYAKTTYLLSVLTVVSLAANVTFNIIGISLLGTVGAALGTLCAGLTGVAVYNLVADRYYRIEWETRKLIAMAGVLVVSSTLVLLLMSAGVPYAVRLGVKLALCGVYLALGVRLALVTRDNVRAVVAAVASKLRPA